jgi:hypothetical protein
MLSMLSPSGDGDRLRVRVDAVLDEFRDGLQRIALRQRNDAYGVPIIPDLQPATIGIPLLCEALFFAILRPARPAAALCERSSSLILPMIARRPSRPAIPAW